MKTFCISLVTLSVVLISVQAQTRGAAQALAHTLAQEPSPLRFAAVEHDFGTIREQDGPVSHTFEFTNRGSSPVSIDRVVVSCGCTTPDYPKSPIQPGRSAKIMVTLDPRGMPGEFSKSVVVMSGGGKHRDFLIIKGNVIPRPKSIEEQFPHDMGGGLRVSGTMLTFRTVAQGRSSAMAVDFVNTSEKPVQLTFEPVEGSGLVDVYSSSETVCAGCRGAITFTYDLSERTVYGLQYDVTRPVIDGTPSEKTIYTAMTGIDDFDGVDTADAPRFFLSSSFHDFGEVRRRMVPYIHRVVASNEGSGELHIRSVSSPAGLKVTLRDGMTIPPSGELPFEVLFHTAKYSPGEEGQSIHIVVDDPMRPTREIRIAAIVKE